MISTSDITLMVMPDGPVAFDGINYRYSKGERLYLDNLAKDFKEVQLVTFVLRHGEPFYDSCVHSKFESKNIVIKELPKPLSRNPGVLGKGVQFFIVFIHILRLVRKVDLGYLFLPSYPSAMGWLALNIFRKKHIVYGADDWVQASESMFRWPEKKNTLLYRAYASLNKYMEKVVVSSALFGVAAGGQLIEKYNVYGCQTYPTSPRMTLSRSDIFERENTCEGEKITFINVGSLIHDKAQHVLLEAFSLCCQNYENLELNIVGDGPERMNLELLSEKLGIANKVHFLGYIEEESTLYGYLRNADVFALSSVTEGFPRVLYEAMAMRLPIVTTDVGGIPFLLSNKENALLVKPGNPSQLSESLNVVIEDNNLRKKMIRIASQTIEEVFTRMDGSQISKLLLKHNAIS